jgi:hypothetical protein
VVVRYLRNRQDVVNHVVCANATQSGHRLDTANLDVTSTARQDDAQSNDDTYGVLFQNLFMINLFNDAKFFFERMTVLEMSGLDGDGA